MKAEYNGQRNINALKGEPGNRQASMWAFLGICTISAHMPHPTPVENCLVVSY